MGFVRGLRKYDLEKLNPVSKKPYELSTYVTWWIRQSADIGVESQRKDAKLTVKLVKRIREYYKTFYILKTKLTNEPSVSEIADYLGTPTEYIQAIKDIIENSVPLSLDEPSGGGEGNEGTLMDCIADTSNVFGDIANKDFFDYIMHIANEVLQIRERNILLMRFRIAPYENPGKDIE